SLKKIGAARRYAVAAADNALLRNERGEDGLPCFERKVHQVFPFVPEQVEYVKQQVAVGFAAPVLQLAEAGDAFGSNHHNFAVDHRTDTPGLYGIKYRVKFIIE